MKPRNHPSGQNPVGPKPTGRIPEYCIIAQVVVTKTTANLVPFEIGTVFFSL